MEDRSCCFYCRRRFDNEIQFLNKTIDHFIPMSRGGLNNEYNTLYSCWECNQWKGNMLPERWQTLVQRLIKKKSPNRGTYTKHHYGEIVGAIRHKLSKINMKKASIYNY